MVLFEVVANIFLLETHMRTNVVQVVDFALEESEAYIAGLHSMVLHKLALQCLELTKPQDLTSLQGVIFVVPRAIYRV